MENDTRIVEHLKKHAGAARTLGLRCVPDRTTVGRWWRRYFNQLKETFGKICSMLRLTTPTTLLVADSTPLEDLYDLEAKWSYVSE